MTFACDVDIQHGRQTAVLALVCSWTLRGLVWGLIICKRLNFQIASSCVL